MKKRLINFIFATIKSILTILIIPFASIIINRNISLYYRNYWLYENGSYLLIILFTLYFIIFTFEIILYCFNKHTIKTFFKSKEKYFIFDFTGLVSLTIFIIFFIKDKSFFILFSSEKENPLKISKRILYEDFDKLENIFDKRRALVNGLMSNKIKPEEFKNKIDKLKW